VTDLEPHWRLRVLVAGAILAFAILGVRAWRLQVVKGPEYAAWADRVRLRQITLPSLRGVIYDRRGQILVRNVPSFAVSIIPADLPDDRAEERAVISRLVTLLQITDDAWIEAPYMLQNNAEITEDRWEAHALTASVRGYAGIRDPVDIIQARLDQVRDLAPYQPLLIKTDVAQEQAFVLEEAHRNLPGVHISVEPARDYLTGALTSHALGYVGPIPGEQLKSYVDKGYSPTDQVGLAGLELVYENTLRGVPGQRVIEVDVAGREVREVGEVISPTAGNNLVLTLDVPLQKIAVEALQRGLEDKQPGSGVVIAMDPNNGEILAMVSLPNFDNNIFSGGVKWRDYQVLAGDSRRPLVNNAISGQYPPGSTFKIVPAAAALQEKVITPATQVRCDGVMYLPNQYFPDDLDKAQPFFCWISKYERGHGPTSVEEALAQSCDIFFYQVSGGFRDFAGLGLDRLALYARAFGFGELTGIDLPGETAGLVPSAQWKRLNYGESWVTGDTYNMSIGQGFMLSSPLQLLNATAAIANGGTLYRPHLLKAITDPDGKTVSVTEPTIIRRLDVSDKNIATVHAGLKAVVSRGTATTAALTGIQIAGKTGTAEYAGPRDAKGNLPTHAWFTAYAPADKPQIVLVVFVYNGGEGSETAAPIATEILSRYFNAPAPFLPQEDQNGG
jgi:penicillin-binding protein 2